MIFFHMLDGIMRQNSFSGVYFDCFKAYMPQNKTSHGMFSQQVSFGNSRKDVILIGVGVTVAGFALKYGLEVRVKKYPFMILLIGNISFS